MQQYQKWTLTIMKYKNGMITTMLLKGLQLKIKTWPTKNFHNFLEKLTTNKTTGGGNAPIKTFIMKKLDPFWIEKLEQHFGVDENGNLLDRKNN